MQITSRQEAGLPHDVIDFLVPRNTGLCCTLVTSLIMEDEHRDLLQKHRTSLEKDLEPAKVASQLFSKGIFSADDKDEVTSKATTFEKNEALLDKLPRKGPKAFNTFCDVLKDIGATHLEQLLRPGQEDGESG